MKQIQIIATCDRTRIDTGEPVPADETVFLAFGPDPEHLDVRELDLTEAWGKQLREFLKPFLDASHTPDEIVTGPGGSDGVVPQRRRGAVSYSAISWHRSMRAWADETGFTMPDGRPGYRRLGKGGFYYSPALRRQYEAHLAKLAGAPEQPH